MLFDPTGIWVASRGSFSTCAVITALCRCSSMIDSSMLGRSGDPLYTSFLTVTFCVWPVRWLRPMACSSVAGFQLGEVM